MDIQIQLTETPISGGSQIPPALVGQYGAWVEFWGIVRAVESGRRIAALEYEAYAPMAISVMRRIAHELGMQHPFQFFRAVHRIGIVPVGEAAVHVAVASERRANAFAVITEFMDRLKQDVPIWKIRVIEGQASSEKLDIPQVPGTLIKVP